MSLPGFTSLVCLTCPKRIDLLTFWFLWSLFEWPQHVVAFHFWVQIGFWASYSFSICSCFLLRRGAVFLVCAGACLTVLELVVNTTSGETLRSVSAMRPCAGGQDLRYPADPAEGRPTAAFVEESPRDPFLRLVNRAVKLVSNLDALLPCCPAPLVHLERSPFNQCSVLGIQCVPLLILVSLMRHTITKDA